MKKCQNCKGTNKNKDKYCRNCGLQLHNELYYAVTNILIKIIIIIFILLIALFIASFMNF